MNNDSENMGDKKMFLFHQQPEKPTTSDSASVKPLGVSCTFSTASKVEILNPSRSLNYYSMRNSGMVLPSVRMNITAQQMNSSGNISNFLAASWQNHYIDAQKRIEIQQQLQQQLQNSSNTNAIYLPRGTSLGKSSAGMQSLESLTNAHCPSPSYDASLKDCNNTGYFPFHESHSLESESFSTDRVSSQAGKIYQKSIVISAMKTLKENPLQGNNGGKPQSISHHSPLQQPVDQPTVCGRPVVVLHPQVRQQPLHSGQSLLFVTPAQTLLPAPPTTSQRGYSKLKLSSSRCEKKEDNQNLQFLTHSNIPFLAKNRKGDGPLRITNNNSDYLNIATRSSEKSPDLRSKPSVTHKFKKKSMKNKKRKFRSPSSSEVETPPKRELLNLSCSSKQQPVTNKSDQLVTPSTSIKVAFSPSVNVLYSLSKREPKGFPKDGKLLDGEENWGEFLSVKDYTKRLDLMPEMMQGNYRAYQEHRSTIATIKQAMGWTTPSIEKKYDSIFLNNKLEKIKPHQVKNVIPDSASSTFFIMDRRINFDLFNEAVSCYSLIRAWVQDDPNRYTPPTGSTLLNFTSYRTRGQHRFVHDPRLSVVSRQTDEITIKRQQQQLSSCCFSKEETKGKNSDLLTLIKNLNRGNRQKFPLNYFLKTNFFLGLARRRKIERRKWYKKRQQVARKKLQRMGISVLEKDRP